MPRARPPLLTYLLLHAPLYYVPLAKRVQRLHPSTCLSSKMNGCEHAGIPAQDRKLDSQKVWSPKTWVLMQRGELL